MKSINLMQKLTPGFDLLFRGKSYASAQSRLAGFWSQMGQAVVSWLTYESELRVWQEPDADGNDLWHAYDPMGDRAFYTDSEDEMRQWIEQRHYVTPAGWSPLSAR